MTRFLVVLMCEGVHKHPLEGAGLPQGQLAATLDDASETSSIKSATTNLLRRLEWT